MDIIAKATSVRRRKIILASNLEYEAYLAVVTTENRIRLVGPDHCRLQGRVTVHTRQQHRIIQAHLLNFLKILEDKSQIRRFSFGAARAVPQRHARRFSWHLVSSNGGQRPCHGHAAPSTLRFQRHSPPNLKPLTIASTCTFLAPPAAARLLIAVTPPTSPHPPPPPNFFSDATCCVCTCYVLFRLGCHHFCSRRC